MSYRIFFRKTFSNSPVFPPLCRSSSSSPPSRLLLKVSLCSNSHQSFLAKPFFIQRTTAASTSHCSANFPYRNAKSDRHLFGIQEGDSYAGWEGSAHDSRILSNALSRPRGLRISEGKYYLADAGYGIRNEYITPYRGVRYHLKEFSDQGLENAKGLFNLRHSSLRITIECVFGILKKRFRVLDAEPFWNFQTQVDIVLACCIIHNHIMGVDPSDLLNYGLYEEAESDLIIPTLTEREEREEAREWSAKRDEIAQTMWTDYMARNISPMRCEACGKSFEDYKKPVADLCTIRDESDFGWDDNMKMITCDRATYDAAVMAHKKYEPFVNKSIDHYDEMALVVGKDKATGSFARIFADIDLDEGNQDSVPIDGDNEEIEEVRTNVSSSGTSKRKRKNVQESVVDKQIKFVGEQLGKIANALEQFTADKTPHLYEEVMSMEEEGFDDDFLCSVFDYLVSHESEAKAFLVKSKKHRKIWLQKFSQGCRY
ncbi:hypothetical protein CXB51_017432 [Gossypium anomalum]|uniref:DDE Tnp4 domain-containing protein n=1 Tax=Gossypium anomalum TaxID=47600 RepID=A0A8J5Z6E6_9ROSI|nr:hypothetical protein CXB51_017432 [Gossypium anomalum]